VAQNVINNLTLQCKGTKTRSGSRLSLYNSLLFLVWSPFKADGLVWCWRFHWK